MTGRQPVIIIKSFNLLTDLFAEIIEIYVSVCYMSAILIQYCKSKKNPIEFYVRKLIYMRGNGQKCNKIVSAYPNQIKHTLES